MIRNTMQRKKISPSVFVALAFFLIAVIVLIEHNLKKLLPGWFLPLDLLSKACLSMITGSIFFLVTEWFKSNKAQEKAADVQREILNDLNQSVRYALSWTANEIEGNHGAIGGDPNTDDFHMLIGETMKRVLTGNKGATSPTYHDAMVDLLYRSVLREVERISRTCEPYRATFSQDITRILVSIEKGFPLGERRADRYSPDLSIAYVHRFLKLATDVVNLENTYRREHGLPEWKGQTLPPLYASTAS
jgi:hypothetical protein